MFESRQVAAKPGAIYRHGGAVNDYRRGGPVSGGPPGIDTVAAEINGNTPAKLNNGEYVLPAATVAALGGTKALDALVLKTNGKEPVGYAAGGRVSAWDALANRGKQIDQAVDAAVKGPPAPPGPVAAPPESPVAMPERPPEGGMGTFWRRVTGQPQKYALGGSVDYMDPDALAAEYKRQMGFAPLSGSAPKEVGRQRVEELLARDQAGATTADYAPVKTPFPDQAARLRTGIAGVADTPGSSVVGGLGQGVPALPAPERRGLPAPDALQSVATRSVPQEVSGIGAANMQRSPGTPTPTESGYRAPRPPVAQDHGSVYDFFAGSQAPPPAVQPRSAQGRPAARALLDATDDKRAFRDRGLAPRAPDAVARPSAPDAVARPSAGLPAGFTKTVNAQGTQYSGPAGSMTYVRPPEARGEYGKPGVPVPMHSDRRASPDDYLTTNNPLGISAANMDAVNTNTRRGVTGRGSFGVVGGAPAGVSDAAYAQATVPEKHAAKMAALQAMSKSVRDSHNAVRELQKLPPIGGDQKPPSDAQMKLAQDQYQFEMGRRDKRQERADKQRTEFVSSLTTLAKASDGIQGATGLTPAQHAFAQEAGATFMDHMADADPLLQIDPARHAAVSASAGQLYVSPAEAMKRAVAKLGKGAPPEELQKEASKIEQDSRKAGIAYFGDAYHLGR